jgi:molybdenum cofactor cytidylyltransferase
MFHCIYLAAGYSRRYGSNKLREIYRGKEMYRHVLDRLLDIQKEKMIDIDITVVTQYPEIEKDMKELPVCCTVNPDPSRGISSSLQTGIESLQSRGRIHEGDYLVFFVGDQPELQKTSIENFLTAAEYSGSPYACMAAEETLGNPCAFSAEKIPELMDLRGDKGGKKILLAHPEEVYAFGDINPEELKDLDKRPFP